MEFLLINHPLDCPICDQGGECELQDVSMGYGRSVSRYVDRKRVVADEDLGPLVATDMTRCIQCTRCVRFTADIAGTYELGGMYRGEDLQIGTYDGKPLMSEISGNVIDVCPVGALTNKVFRFRARAWELTARESLGYHDALGSNLFLHVYRHQVLRTVPRDNEAVNECWLSDRDRYSHEGLLADDRATRPLLRDGDTLREASWDEALAAAGAILKGATGDRLGMLVHPATGNEEGALLASLAAGLGTANLDHRLRQLDLADDARAEAFQMPVADLDKVAAVLLVGCNLRHELPLLHQRLFKAGKRGAKVFAVNPVDFESSFAWAGQRIVAPSRLADELGAIERGADDGARAIADALRAAGGNAVVILGEIAENGPHASRIRAAATALAQATGAKVNRIPQGANALGLATLGVLPGDGGRNAQEMLAGGLDACLLYGVEPRYDFADATAALKALAGARVVAFSAFASESLRQVADVILPIGLVPEIETTLTNVDGRSQSTAAGARLPGEAKSGWRVLRALGEILGTRGFDFTDLDGLRGSIAARSVPVRARNSAAPAAGEGLERIATTPIYRGDAVLRRAPALNAHPLTLGPRIALHPDDAKALGLADGGLAKVGDGAGTAVLPVAVTARVARGAAWIESHYDATAPISSSVALGIARASA